MEGLEISIINYSEVLNHTLSSRFDAEFFKQEYLKDDKSIAKNGFNKLVDVTSKINVGFVGAMVKHYRTEGITILQTKNIDAFFINDNNTIKITSQFHNELRKSKIHKKDILIARSGSFGKASIYLDDNVINSSDIIIVEANENSINPYFLVSYLNSKFGINQMIRFASGGLQGHVNLTILEELEIPKINVSFQKEIEKLLELAYTQKQNSKQKYTQAQNLLLAEIGLKDFTPSKEPINIKSFKDSFDTSGRLDAEYYQVKYDDYISLVNGYSNGSEIISTICNLNGNNFKPESEKIYNYIELSNVGKSGDINGCTVNIGKELPSRARRKVNTNDVIISSIEGSLNSCALVTKEYNNALCSTGFYVINSDKINSETLLVLFKSELMQNILKQNCSGTILTGMNKDDFLNIRIPKIIENKQQQIAELIEQSFTLKKQSEHLLEVAKKAVEIAIEENESIALKYMNQETK